jgi:hypothetical protein
MIYIGRTRISAKIAAGNKANSHIFKNTKRTGCLGQVLFGDVCNLTKFLSFKLFKSFSEMSSYFGVA